MTVVARAIAIRPLQLAASYVALRQTGTRARERRFSSVGHNHSSAPMCPRGRCVGLSTISSLRAWLRSVTRPPAGKPAVESSAEAANRESGVYLPVATRSDADRQR